MIFCGQCGYQLAPGETRCPRCGSLVESNIDLASTVQDYHPDDPTVESRSFNTRQPSQAAAAQQKLVLRSADPDYSTQPGQEETTRAILPGPLAPPAPPDAQTSYPGYTPQGISYTGSAPQRSAIYPPPDASYPAYGAQPVDYAGQYQPARRRSPVGRTIALLLILLGLLFIMGAIALFALRSRGITSNANQHNGSSAITVTTTVPAAATVTPSPTSVSAPPQALAVIQQYYNDINHRSYRAAYNLWKNNPQGFLAFRNGFKNTVRDQVTPGSATVQADGTVKIPVTVNATETVQSGKGTRHVTYQGYYIVGQQAGGSWQILSGYLSPA